MLDVAADGAAPGEWLRRGPGHPADRPLFGFTGLAIGAASLHTGPENP